MRKKRKQKLTAFEVAKFVIETLIGAATTIISLMNLLQQVR